MGESVKNLWLFLDAWKVWAMLIEVTDSPTDGIIYPPLNSFINGVIPMKNTIKSETIQLTRDVAEAICRRLYKTHHKPVRGVLAHLVPIMLHTGLTLERVASIGSQGISGSTVVSRDSEGRELVTELNGIAYHSLYLLRQEPAWWRQEEPELPLWDYLLTRPEEDIRPSYAQLENSFNEVLKELDMDGPRFEDLPFVGHALRESQSGSFGVLLDRIRKLSDVEAVLLKNLISIQSQTGLFEYL